jgi:hypothetical protein
MKKEKGKSGALPLFFFGLFIFAYFVDRTLRIFWGDSWRELPYVKWVHDNVPTWLGPPLLTTFIVCVIIMYMRIPKYPTLQLCAAIIAITAIVLIIMMSYDKPDFLQPELVITVLLLLPFYMYHKHRKNIDKKERNRSA